MNSNMEMCIFFHPRDGKKISSKHIHPHRVEKWEIIMAVRFEYLNTLNLYSNEVDIRL